jgi:hypothetical protein
MLIGLRATTTRATCASRIRAISIAGPVASITTSSVEHQPKNPCKQA